MKKKNVPVTFSLKEPLLWSTFVQNNGMQILTPSEKKKKKKFPVTVVLVSFTKVKPSFRETHFHILKVSNG